MLGPRLSFCRLCSGYCPILVDVENAERLRGILDRDGPRSVVLYTEPYGR